MWIETDDALISIDGACQIKTGRFPDDTTSLRLRVFYGPEPANYFVLANADTGGGIQYISSLYEEIRQAIHRQEAYLDFRRESIRKRRGQKAVAAPSDPADNVQFADSVSPPNPHGHNF